MPAARAHASEEHAAECGRVLFRSPRKDSSRARSLLRDVLNVLLNAAIVSATVHRVHKFASAVPSIRSSASPFSRPLPAPSPSRLPPWVSRDGQRQERRRATCHPQFRRTRCTSRNYFSLPSSSSFSSSYSIAWLRQAHRPVHRSAFPNFHSSGNRGGSLETKKKKIVYFAGQSHDIHALEDVRTISTDAILVRSESFSANSEYSTYTYYCDFAELLNFVKLAS